MSSEISLSSDFESFIQEEVAIGAYRDRAEVIQAGLDLLRKQKALLVQLDEGQRQLDNDEYVEFDRDGLRHFFEGLKERARRRTAGS
jgi:putative addiction module CopG family antidote